MAESTPGSSGVQLVQNHLSPRFNLELCIICQREKDSKGVKKLTSTEDGRKIIIQTSEKLQDGMVAGIELHDRIHLQYHLKSCYSTYRKKGERHDETQKRKADDECELSSVVSPVTRAKRSKPVVVAADPRDKPCVICNQRKNQGETKRSRVETAEKADCLLKAVNFNKDEVHTRMIFFKEVGDVFAGDVMYHKNCLNKYLNQFERDIEKLLAGNFGNNQETNIIKEAFDELVQSLNLGTNGYAVSDLRDTINHKLKSQNQGKLLLY